MELDSLVRQFAETFADAIVARDFDRASTLLAPWLRAQHTPERLAELIDAEVTATLEACELDAGPYPGTYTFGWNDIGLASLRELPSYEVERKIPNEVTSENYRQWMKIEFQPLEEEELEVDAYFDLWMIVVTDGPGLAVGYFEMVDSD